MTIGFAVGSGRLVPILACGSSGIESSALDESFVVVPAFRSGWFVVLLSIRVDMLLCRTRTLLVPVSVCSGLSFRMVCCLLEHSLE